MLVGKPHADSCSSRVTFELTPEREREVHARQARARAWRYVFDCYEKKKAGAGDGARAGEEAKGAIDEVRPEKSVRA